MTAGIAGLNAHCVFKQHLH